MSALKQPHQLKRPKLSAAEQVQMIVNEMILLETFPDHVQAEEFRRNINYAKTKLPALYEQAEELVRARTAEEGRLRVHPEECTRCKGTGVHNHQGHMRFCGCPAGDIAMKTKVLSDSQPPRLASTPKPMAEKRQLQQLRSLFNEDPSA
jgi:hypothetical protein